MNYAFRAYNRLDHAAKIEPADGKSLERLVALAAVFDPLTGMCDGFYVPCIGVIGTWLVADPMIGMMGSSDFLLSQAEGSDGTISHESWQTSFGSSDPAIINVGAGGFVSFLSRGRVSLNGGVELPFWDGRDIYFCPLLFFLAFACGESNSGPNRSTCI